MGDYTKVTLEVTIDIPNANVLGLSTKQVLRTAEEMVDQALTDAGIPAYCEAEKVHE